MVLFHPSYDLWLAAGAAASAVPCSAQQLATAKRNMWEQHRAERLEAQQWFQVVTLELARLRLGGEA